MEKVIVNSGIKDMGIKSSSAFAQEMPNMFVPPTIFKISDKDTRELYRGNEWCSAVINRIVNDSTKIKPRVAPRDKSKKTTGALKRRIKEVEEFLDDPNQNKESFRDIREKFLRDQLIYGRGTLEKVLTPKSRYLIEIYALISKQVRVKTDEHGMLPEKNAYEQLVNNRGKNVKFDRDEIIFAVALPDTESVYGIKHMDLLCNAIAGDILRSSYNNNFFTNGAEASGVLSMEGMSKAELKKFRQYWQANHKGVKNAHKILAVNTKIDFKPMALNNRDMEFTEYGMELRNKIFAVYGMQPIIMGVIDAGTGKLNSEQQIQAYKDGALVPLLEKESYVYTHDICKQGFGFEDVVIDFPTIDLADAITQSEIDRSDTQAAIVTINEVRRRRGMTDVPWGDTPVMITPGGGQIDPETGRLIPPSENSNDNSNSNDDDDEDDDEKNLRMNKITNLLKGWFLTKESDNIKEDELDETIGKIVLDIDERKYLEALADEYVKMMKKGFHYFITHSVLVDHKMRNTMKYKNASIFR